MLPSLLLCQAIRGCLVVSPPMSRFRPANGKTVQWRGGRPDELVLAQVPKVVVEIVLHGCCSV